MRAPRAMMMVTVMSREEPPETGAPVPAHRAERLARFGGLAVGVAGDALARGVGKAMRGERPAIGDLLLTPATARRLAGELARLRGAAMKVGQLLSMDAGDLLPAEFADILARLRSAGAPMPPRQLKRVLEKNWGRNWLSRFRSFDPRPIAAASIGQVHRARATDGRDLAIKVQYPGVRESIDSDVDNVALLIKTSGLVPKSVDIAPLLDEAKRQSTDEADYLAEGARLDRFGGLLADAPDFLTPTLDAALTTRDVLAMSYVEGAPIETLENAPQETRDRVRDAARRPCFSRIVRVSLHADGPEFRQLPLCAYTDQIALLDFGAARDVPQPLVDGYRRMLRAGMAGDAASAEVAARAIGLSARPCRRKRSP